MPSGAGYRESFPVATRMMSARVSFGTMALQYLEWFEI
jgi:hypothetical protein